MLQLQDKSSNKKGEQENDPAKAQSCLANRVGDMCPSCGQSKLVYNGLLNLFCTTCGYTSPGGAFT